MPDLTQADAGVLLIVGEGLLTLQVLAVSHRGEVRVIGEEIELTTEGFYTRGGSC